MEEDGRVASMSENDLDILKIIMDHVLQKKRRDCEVPETAVKTIMMAEVMDAVVASKTDEGCGRR